MSSAPIDPAFIPYRVAASHLKAQLISSNSPSPIVGIICGSGLSGLSSTLTSTRTIPYGTVPGFPSQCTVTGHTGEMVFGMLSGVPTVCFRGRFHSYEGHDMHTVVLPVRVMRCLGVRLLIVTNAAGGLNAEYRVGDVVNIMDHFALPMLAGKNPLVGPNDEELGPRFPPSSNAYDPKLQDVVMTAANTVGFADFVRQNGTYCFVSGPMYESPAECKFLRGIGGDAVGMSTIPEIIAAHHCGIKVLCLSLITNKALLTGEEGPAASHSEVLEAVEKRSNQMQELVKEIVAEMRRSGALREIPELPNLNLELDENQVKRESRQRSTSFPSHPNRTIPLHCAFMGGLMIALGSLIGTSVFKKR